MNTFLPTRAVLAIVLALPMIGGHWTMAQAQETTGGSAQVQSGPSSLQETYQDWVVRCATTQSEDGDSGGRVCEMRQELRQAQSNQRVLTVALQPAAEGEGANMTLVAPFGLLLSEGISISVADSNLVTVPFRTCLPGGCIGQVRVPQAVVGQLAAGDEARFGMVTTAEQPLAVTVSLTGFTAAWNRLLELRD